MLPLRRIPQRRSVEAVRRPSSEQENTDLKTMKAGLLCLAMCAAVAPKAQAQMTWTDQAFANISGGYQGGSDTLTTNTPFELYDEQGTVTSSQKVSGGGLFDISVGYKVWRNLAAGVGIFAHRRILQCGGHRARARPAVFNQLRTVTASASDLKHSENVIHLTATWMVPVTDKIDVGVSAGPAIFRVKQDLPSAVTVTEPGPTVSAVTIDNVTKTSVGIDLGVDVTYLVTKGMGIGGLARYTRASSDLSGASENVTVGGFQIGGGLRIRF